MVYILFLIVVYILVEGFILLFMHHHQCVYFIVLVMYMLVVFICFLSFYICVCLFSYPPISLVLFSAICVTFIHEWMKTFGGVCISVLSYAAKCVF